MKKTKHRRCWFCGNRIQGKGVMVEIKGHDVDAHRNCARESAKQEARENNAFGLEE